ncbi:hypothetical protein [Wenzhouxiangella sediminis]|uniref:Uncharacterized protein n=1 Tax=Wenzhouxiangella sediminis TaxID=1792836 RepID=A0A3E1K5W5_9GAMM|nr:hypothetical protein [Wenzhouxiangella sediminis]RFF29409.1 hypothetical protein DZC52_13265 [Wenzhouxiangella sediminis]
MEKIDQLFAKLDKWRNLPTYQLERRADIFFSLYLREVLEVRTGLNIHETLIPEFPLHKKTLDSEKGNNQSFRADYLAFSSDLNKVWLVELKTDGGSTRLSQNDYLKQAKNAGFNALLKGLIRVISASSSKRKYLHLLKDLERVGVIANVEGLDVYARQSNLRGFTNELRQVNILPADPVINLVCIHPLEKENDDFDEWISFQQFRQTVKRYGDHVSVRFCESLQRWETKAGLVAPE